MDVHNSQPYAGFNMLLLSPSSIEPDGPFEYDALYVTNHGAGGKISSRKLTTSERRCGGLSNGVDGQGAETWPKVQVGISALENAVFLSDETPDKIEEARLINRLFDLLRSGTLGMNQIVADVFPDGNPPVHQRTARNSATPS
jgi:uncharacterized protein with NRDE domain